MMALGKAVAFLGIRLDAAELHCRPEIDGAMRVNQVGVDQSWLVKQHQPRLIVRPVGPTDDRHSVLDDDLTVQGDDAPSLAVPMASLASPDLPLEPDALTDEMTEEISLAERLFELSFEIAEAEPEHACRLALTLVQDYVCAEAGSIVRGTLNDDALTFVAVDGPVATQLLGRTVPFGQGLIGQAFDMRATLVANDAAQDLRHLDRIDAETGFTTRVALCVPIHGQEDESLGVIQLINPPGESFTDLHIEVVETVARTLAGTMAR
jgi:GAF domain-containing protein